ncbi:SDR family oxidoreductase [Jannaschia sp. CCS1]|uniref:SDR family oxidoreductase n=1 Tax=Jannaschia sp. (strain CCS1) TaxID=290400 RepID=UPI000053D252|nr:SDR family oxidoreductase [Jannaschia sp. CCS1]ABD56107.1 short-chain dehydrogenase/reductase SDR [Jannaschia sp. CCS1]
MTTLITGANRGLGLGLAEHYRTAGETVIGTSRDGEAGVRLDVTDTTSLANLSETLGDDPIDTLICNAGVFLDRHEKTETGYAAKLWKRTFATNVMGVFLTIQTVLPNLKTAKTAKTPKIVIISSQMGSSAKAGGNALIYRASKAAALNLGRNLAVDLELDGIAVGIYHPGWVRTDMGGGGAAISVYTSVKGLSHQIEALSLETTGCFLNWDGNPQDY